LIKASIEAFFVPEDFCDKSDRQKKAGQIDQQTREITD